MLRVARRPLGSDKWLARPEPSGRAPAAAAAGAPEGMAAEEDRGCENNRWLSLVIWLFWLFKGNMVQNRYKFGLDGLGLLVLGAVLWAGPVGDWVAGRFVASVQNPPCIWPVFSVVAGVWALIRIVRAAVSRKGLARVVTATSIILGIALPWMILGPNAYALGFASWAGANLDVQAVRNWAAGVPLDSAIDTKWVPWWVDRQDEQQVWLKVPRPDWPDAINRLQPDDVFIEPDREYTIIVWWGGAWGYEPNIAVGAFESTPPLDRHNKISVSQFVRKGVWSAVRPPVG